MLLSELLRPDRIKLNLDAEDKEEAIRELVDHLVQVHDISYSLRDHVVETVIAQERRNGSGMEHGIAVPHGVTDRIEDFLAVLGVSGKGVPFDTPDGQPARLVVLLVAPKRDFAGEVRTLAGIEKLLEHPGLKEQLTDAQDPKAAYELIRTEETAAA